MHAGPVVVAYSIGVAAVGLIVVTWEDLGAGALRGGGGNLGFGRISMLSLQKQMYNTLANMV